jgi:hypothetical protein
MSDSSELPHGYSKYNAQCRTVVLFTLSRLVYREYLSRNDRVASGVAKEVKRVAEFNALSPHPAQFHEHLNKILISHFFIIIEFQVSFFVP